MLFTEDHAIFFIGDTLHFINWTYSLDSLVITIKPTFYSSPIICSQNAWIFVFKLQVFIN